MNRCCSACVIFQAILHKQLISLAANTIIKKGSEAIMHISIEDRFDIQQRLLYTKYTRGKANQSQKEKGKKEKKRF
jgi:hypothetical protein